MESNASVSMDVYIVGKMVNYSGQAHIGICGYVQ